jgi:hypothetical protein
MSTAAALRARFLRAGLAAVARNPRLAVEAVRAAAALRPRRRQGVGAVDRYLAWRSLTAHGDPASPPSPEETAAFLAWRRRMRIGR